jgi:2-polyprenyl-3-methyl-5-hydroxy-6-metoxy-1,4-benzoquinol methylase
MHPKIELNLKNAEVSAIAGLKGYKFISHQRRKKKIIGLVNRHCSSGSSVLDVGCGCGDISLELALGGYDVVGIDLEPVRIENANALARKYGKAELFFCKRFQDFKSSEKFDAVLMGEVLEHFNNPVDVLIKVKKVLSPGGIVIITTPNMPGLHNRLKFGFLGVFPDNNPEHKYYFDHRRFKYVTTKAGFNIALFETCFTNLLMRGFIATHLENILFGWYSKLFKKSGDILCAVLCKEE